MKSIMIQGTASGVGKTVLTLALCRIFKQDGCKVSPFKAQNMTTNTCLLDSGDEIAVSQWLQAMAAGVKPKKDMNPIVIKPMTHKSVAPANNPTNIPAKPAAKLSLIMSAYDQLRADFELIVIEGAGSPVELNLNKNDVINIGLAARIKSPVILVSDIDRGGIFAALYGTINLMGGSERELVKATIVNRFRGETALFSDGVKILENITKLPVAGVVPFFDVGLPEEDSLFSGEIGFETERDYEQQFDRAADIVRQALDMRLIYKILNGA